MRIEQMQVYVNQLLHRYGHTNSKVNVLPLDSQSPNYDQFYAGAIGCNLIITLTGSIYVNTLNLKQQIFTDHEIQFVLAHEYMHLRKNDCLLRGLEVGVERALKGPIQILPSG